MKNLITYLSKKSLSLGNGSGMTRQCFGITSTKSRNSLDSILSRFCVASLICLCMLTIGVGNMWGAILYNDNFGNVGSNSNSYTTRTGWTLSNTYAHYNSGIRLGTSGGYATKSGMSSIVGTKDIQVTVYVAKWNNDASSLVVTVNGTAKIDGNSSKTFSSIVKTTSTGGAVTWNSSYLISFIVTGATSSTTIKFGTNASGSRAILGPIRVSDPNEDCGVFYESWDKCTGTGGNDGSWSGSIASSTLTADNTGWTVANGNGASKCAKFGTGSNKGSAQTPAITYTGSNNLVLTFKAGAWNGGSEGTTLNLSATNATLDKSSVTLTKGAWTTYTVNITSITSGFKIKWEAKNASNNRFFLDDICISENITPSCDAPTGLTNGAHQDATTGNNGSQVVSWSGSAANYDVCVNASNSVPTSETSPDHTGSATSYTISGKNPGNYRWWVRSNCGGEKSDWVEGTSFTIKGIKTGGTIPVAFGTVGQGSTVAAKTITVTGIGLTSGTSITATFPSGSPFSVDPTSVAYNADHVTLTISASTANVGAYDQNLTLSYGGTYTATVKVTMTVVAVDRFIDVLQNTAGYEEATPHTELGTYSTPTLADKAVATTGTCEQQHYHFVGWITAAKYAAGTAISDGDLQTPTTASNATYYAVWAKQGAGGGGTTWTQVTSVSVGDQVVIAEIDDGTVELTGFNTTITTGNNYGTGTTFSTNPVGTMIWTVEAGSSTGQFSFKNGDYYLNLSSSNNYLNGSTSKNSNSSWTITESNSRAKITSASYATRSIMYKTSGRFACYAKSHGEHEGGDNTDYYYVILYKKGSGVSYEDYKASCCANLITIAAPTITGSGCNITFDLSSPVETCSSAKDVVATVSVTNGYKVTELSFTVDAGTVGISPAIAVPYTSSQDFTLSFSQNHAAATLTTTATVVALQDKYYDYMHDNALKHTKSGNYGTAPTLDSKSVATEAGCMDNHYKFIGWVISTDVNDDGSLKGGYTLIPGGATGKYATGATYIAVWAEEE